MLSLGEQQRWWRGLLHAPQYLFLDEATARSMNLRSQALRLLREKLPASTIVSIGTDHARSPS